MGYRGTIFKRCEVYEASQNQTQVPVPYGRSREEPQLILGRAEDKFRSIGFRPVLRV